MGKPDRRLENLVIRFKKLVNFLQLISVTFCFTNKFFLMPDKKTTEQPQADWKEKLEDKAEELKDKAEEVWDKVEDKAEDVWKEVKDKAEDLKDGAEKLWNKIVDKFDGDEPTPAEPKK